MAIKFYRLLDLMNKRGISKGKLQSLTGFSSATVAKISDNGNLSLDAIDKICDVLDVQPENILEFVREESKNIDCDYHTPKNEESDKLISG